MLIAKRPHQEIRLEPRRIHWDFAVSALSGLRTCDKFSTPDTVTLPCYTKNTGGYAPLEGARNESQSV